MDNFSKKHKSDYSRNYSRESYKREYDHRKKEYYERSEPCKTYRNDQSYNYRRKDYYNRRDNSGSPDRYRNRYQFSKRRNYSRSNSISPDRISSNSSRRYSSYNTNIEKSQDSKLDKVKKDLEFSNRDDLTVLVMNLNLNAQEFEVYEFFTTYAGNVRDIRIIRDHRTGRSKGVCYVEFYSVESVLKALKLNGQKIMDTSITIQASQAEKNRAAKLAKLEEIKAETTPLLLRVDGLVGLLARIKQDEIDSLFSTFGKVVNIDIGFDQKTQECLGFAHILFEKAIEGHDAIKALNNFEIAGQKITVTMSQENQSTVQLSNNLDSLSCNSSQLNSGIPNSQIEITKKSSITSNPERVSEFDQLDESEETVLLGADSRNFLTKKLLARAQSRTDHSSIQENSNNAISPIISNNQIPPLSSPSTPLTKPSNSQTCQNEKTDNTTGVNSASNNSQVEPTCLLFSNMFTEQSIKESMEEDETVEQVLEEIQADVEEECEKYGTLIECFLDKDKKDGNVWVKYSHPDEASKAKAVFHGRFFGGRKLSVSFIKQENFPKSVKS